MLPQKKPRSSRGFFIAWRFNVVEVSLMSSRHVHERTFEWIGRFRRDLSLRPNVMLIAVRAKRPRLKVREALEASPIGLDAGLDETASAGALDHELEHEHDGISMRYRGRLRS